MKKVLLLLTVICGLSVSSFAQSSNGGKFSVGLEAGLPLGDAHQVYKAIIGGSLKYEHPVATNTFVTLSAGYNSFLTKSEWKPFLGSSNGAIPVKAGLKYYFNEGFFGEGQLGAAFSTENGGGTAFVYAPGIGYTFGGGFEAGVRYEGWSNNGTISQAGLRLAYRF
jgi:hypothetical protein